jgi:hypothetical protein
LEFDVPSEPFDILIPSVFLGPRMETEQAAKADRASSVRHAGFHRWFIAATLPPLIGAAVRHEVACTLFDCLGALPSPAQFYQVGVMLARATRAVRLCLWDLPPGLLPDFLRRIGWSGDYSCLLYLTSNLGEYSDLKIIHIDVAESVGSKIGLECSVRWLTATGSNPRLKPFLNRLVAMSLCRPEKRDALLAWLGYSPYVSILDQRRLGLATYKDAEGRRPLARLLNHIKITLDSNGGIAAKAYLFVV